MKRKTFDSGGDKKNSCTKNKRQKTSSKNIEVESCKRTDDKPNNDGRNWVPRTSNGKWSPKEDTLLQEAVYRNNDKNWKRIAESVPTKTSLQCLRRWTKVLNPDLVKGPWREEEDKKLKQVVEKRGAKNWSVIAAEISGRMGKQCRERWFNHLAPEVCKDGWTEEENLIILMKHAEMGNKWTDISKLLPGRPANSVKNHWYSTLKSRSESEPNTILTPKYNKTNYYPQVEPQGYMLPYYQPDLNQNMYYQNPVNYQIVETVPQYLVPQPYYQPQTYVISENNQDTYLPHENLNSPLQQPVPVSSPQQCIAFPNQQEFNCMHNQQQNIYVQHPEVVPQQQQHIPVQYCYHKQINTSEKVPGEIEIEFFYPQQKNDELSQRNQEIESQNSFERKKIQNSSPPKSWLPPIKDILSSPLDLNSYNFPVISQNDLARSMTVPSQKSNFPNFNHSQIPAFPQQENIHETVCN